MKIAVSISLLMLLSFQVMFKTFLVIDYRMNKEYIAANLCENKATPQMQCEGKCHLKKQIAQSEEAESKTIPSSLKEKEVSFHQSWFELTLPQISVLIESNQYHLPAEEAIISVSNSIFSTAATGRLIPLYSFSCVELRHDVTSYVAIHGLHSF